MAETKTEPSTAMETAVARIKEVQAAKADKIAALYQEKTSTQASIDAWETQVAELQKTADGATVEDITRNIEAQSDLNTKITAGREKIRMLDAQIEYSQTEENFLEFEEYTSLIDELRTGYEEIKRVEFLKAQEHADAMTTNGETIAQARKAAQDAANDAFNMYHGFTRFRTKIVHKCVGDKIIKTVDDRTGAEHTRKKYEYKDFEVPDNSRIQPTIGTAEDISAIRKVSLDFDTRGGRYWWNV